MQVLLGHVPRDGGEPAAAVQDEGVVQCVLEGFDGAAAEGIAEDAAQDEDAEEQEVGEKELGRKGEVRLLEL